MSTKSNFPAIRPSLLLDFANGKRVDPRITFARASTATYFDALGVMQTAPSGSPRIDHDPVTGECRGLLIEEPRTNLLAYSSQPDNAIWGKVNITVSAGAATAPDGTLSGASLIEAAINDRHELREPATTLTAAQYTYSVYAKAWTRNFLSLVYTQGGAVGFDLAAGTTVGTPSGGAVAAIVPAGNGWYRCSMTFTGVAVSASVYTCVRATAGVSVEAYTGDGVSGLYVWGAQLELGAFPTSYIQTAGAQATRAADSASMTGANFSAWYRADEGTLLHEGSAIGGAAGAVAALQSDASANDVIWVQSDLRSGASAYDGAVRVAGALSAQFNYAAAEATGTVSKRALAYRVNDFAFSKNGTSVLTDAAGSLPAAPVRLQLGSASVTPYTGATSSGHIRRLSFYPRRLPNAALQALTA